MSYHFIGFPHEGQADPGRMIETRLGILYMQTLMKLPMMHPNTNMASPIMVSISGAYHYISLSARGTKKRGLKTPSFLSHDSSS